MVDFPQALTALDYLRDLDLRLRREFMGVQTRLGVDPAVGLAGWEDGAGENVVVIWLKSLFDRFREVEMIYPQVYIGLRRWVSLVVCLFFSIDGMSKYGNSS